MNMHSVGGCPISNVMENISRDMSGAYNFGNMRFNVWINLYEGMGAQRMNVIPAGGGEVAGYYRPGSRNIFFTRAARDGTHTHEFLHAMGLGHQPNWTGSIMSYAPYRSVLPSDIYTLYKLYR
jgi:hypothetical protein